MTETMLVRAVKAVETELGKQEMVLTDPLTLRRMMATRAVRAALQAMRIPNLPDEHFSDSDWVWNYRLDKILAEDTQEKS
jgi:hypothetical protein